MAGLTKEILLDDIINLAEKLDINIEDVTYRLYAAQGSFSEKTIYAKFKGMGWIEVINQASVRQAEEMTSTYAELPKKVEEDQESQESQGDLFSFGSEVSEKANPAFDFNFDLDAALKSSTANNPSCLGVPKIHDFTIGKKDVIFGIPDIHSPFFKKSWLVWVVKNILAAVDSGKYETVHVVQMGDALDLYSWGKYEKIVDVNLQSEIEIGLNPIKQLWKTLDRPGVKRYQLIGNHDSRSEKFCIRNARMLKSFVPTAKTMLTFDNVFTVDSEHDGIMFTVAGETDRVLTIHGYLSDSLAHVRKYGVNVMHAHSHRGSLNFFTGKFAMDCGFGGDPSSWVFAYTLSTIRKEWNWCMSKIEVDETGHLQPSLLRYFE
jgi:hypothetical protein